MANLTDVVNSLNEMNRNQQESNELVRDLIAVGEKDNSDEERRHQEEKREKIAEDRFEMGKTGKAIKKAVTNNPLGKAVGSIGKTMFETITDALQKIVGLAAINWLMNPDNIKKVGDFFQAIGDFFDDVIAMFTKFKATWDEKGFFSALSEALGEDGTLAVVLAGAVGAVAALAAPISAIGRMFGMMGTMLKSSAGALASMMGLKKPTFPGDDPKVKKAQTQAEKAYKSQNLGKDKKGNYAISKSGKKIYEVDNKGAYNATKTGVENRAKVQGQNAAAEATKKVQADAEKAKSPKTSSRMARFLKISGPLNAIVSAASIASILQNDKLSDDEKKKQIGGAIGAGVGGTGGAALGAMLGSIIPGLGTLIGAAGGGIAGALAGDQIGEMIAEYLMSGNTSSSLSEAPQQTKAEAVSKAMTARDEGSARLEELIAKRNALPEGTPQATIAAYDKQIDQNRNKVIAANQKLSELNTQKVPTAIAPSTSDDAHASITLEDLDYVADRITTAIMAGKPVVATTINQGGGSGSNNPLVVRTPVA